MQNFQIDYPTIKKETGQFGSLQTPKQITQQQDTQYQEIGQIPSKIKTGSNSNNNVERLLNNQHSSKALYAQQQKSEKSSLVFDEYNPEDNCGSQPNKQNSTSQGQRICPILSGNSSLSSTSSSYGNTNNSISQNNNFTTFKNLTTVNNPVISINGKPEKKRLLFTVYSISSGLPFVYCELR